MTRSNRATNLVFIALFFMALLLSMGASVARAELKIGFIVVEQIQEEAQAYRDAKERLQQEAGAKEREAAQRQQEMERRADNFRRQEAILSESRKTQLQREIVQLQKDYERFALQAQGDLAKRQVDVLGPLQEQVRQIIERLALEDGYDIILDAAAILYMKDPDANNLTTRVIEILNEEAGQATTTSGRPGGGPGNR